MHLQLFGNLVSRKRLVVQQNVRHLGLGLLVTFTLAVHIWSTLIHVFELVVFDAILRSYAVHLSQNDL